MLDGRIVHLLDPLPRTRDLVGLTLSQYSWRVLVATMRDRTDAGWLLEAIVAGEITDAQVEEIADALVEQIFGQPRWVVVRIWGETLAVWREVDAELGAHGIDLLALAPDRATNIAFGALQRRHAGTESAAQRWLSELEEVPARARRTAVSADVAADWFAMAGILGGTAPKIPEAITGVDSELTIT